MRKVSVRIFKFGKTELRFTFGQGWPYSYGSKNKWYHPSYDAKYFTLSRKSRGGISHMYFGI